MVFDVLRVEEDVRDVVGRELVDDRVLEELRVDVRVQVLVEAL